MWKEVFEQWYADICLDICIQNSLYKARDSNDVPHSIMYEWYMQAWEMLIKVANCF